VACAALLLFLLPPRLIAPLKTLQRELQRPGQAVAIACRRWTIDAAARFAAARADADELASRRGEVQQLRRRNERLQSALALAIARDHRSEIDGRLPHSYPLVDAEPLRARVLGRQARAHLARAEVIAAGRGSGVTAGALVLDEPLATLDQGSDAGVASRQLAIVGGCVWGRVTEVGRWTSVVQRANQPGYRDLVQLGQHVGGRLLLGPRGVLEGAGEPLCRVRRVETTAAVSVGDLVVVAGEQGLAETPLVYGHVVRVEQAAGGAHWDIWMSPSARRDVPDELTVVRTRLNPTRLAHGTETRGQ
jgi:cell shape-determining protein MreC